MPSEGTPKRPALIGGAGLCGTNLLVLLASNAGCKELVVVDARPPNSKTLQEAGIDEKRIHFVKHFLGTDDEASLAAALEGCDCVFLMVTPHVQFAAEQDFYKTNIDGVRGLIKACKSKQVPRLVYLSSIAATNHFVPSVEQKEFEALPSMDTYLSPYDITKRKGEEMVLAANSPALRSCALRPASILLSPYDFTMANIFRGVLGFDIAPIPAGMQTVDFIDGRDVCRALVLASQAFETKPEGVAGEAFFVTKAKGPGAGVADVAAIVQKKMGWLALPVPLMLTKCVAKAAHVKHAVRKALGLPVPGIPPHRFIEMAFSQQTFDNSKVRSALGFAPKVTIPEAVERICKVKQAERAAVAKSGNSSKSTVVFVVALVVAVTGMLTPMLMGFS